MNRLPKLVQSVHFEDFSGSQFERLVLAYHLRRYRWLTLEWYGEVGADLGRDIWGVLEDGDTGTSVCIQCANRRRVTLSKVSGDLDKVLTAPRGKPDRFMLVASCAISAGLRDKILLYAQGRRIDHVEVWSGAELEERLRADAESLLRRFVEGVDFPDDPVELKEFTDRIEPASDDEILGLMAEVFDRPAFHTPFYGESSVSDFKKAVTDTIEALNTGMHRLRDGTVIRQIPSRHKLQDTGIRGALDEIVHRLNALRMVFDDLMRSGDIRPCGCNDPNCPVSFASPRAAREMDCRRAEILSAFHAVYPRFQADWRHALW